MLGLLEAILCVLQNILLAILWAGAVVVNVLVLALAGLGVLIAALLPEMPDAPGPPDSGVVGAIAWLYPLGALLAGFLTIVTLWLAVIAVRAALRWVKLL